MQQPRNPLTYLFIGAALGGILGAVMGIAIGSTSGRSAARPVRVETVVSTRTVRVAGLAPPVSPSLADTAPAHTTTTDKTPAVTTTDTTPVTTATDTSTTAPGTGTSTTPADPNEVPPPDRNNPPGDFCITHVCAPDFSRGSGYVVQCVDGIWRRDGGVPGACRKDGGLA